MFRVWFLSGSYLIRDYFISGSYCFFFELGYYEVDLYSIIIDLLDLIIYIIRYIFLVDNNFINKIFEDRYSARD